MNKIFIYPLLCLLLTGCHNKDKSEYNQAKYQVAGPQSEIIEDMIAAVNQKDANKYVQGFADNVRVFVESNMKVDGKESLTKNRAAHFMAHPDVRSEIQHLVEIDNKVILHDKVWLTKDDTVGQDIVEIFTFKGGKVVKVDVIQPKNLFEN